MKRTRLMLLSLAIALPTCVNAQLFHNAELSGGWAHATGNDGLDGFNLGAGLWFTNRISLAFDFDRVGNNKSLPIFALQTNAGLITTKATMQDYLLGPRIFLHSTHIKVLETIHPFAEVQAGASHIRQSVTAPMIGTLTATDNAGTWLFGGGGDILFSPRWAARVNLDFMRTHFVDSGQSRIRLKVGVAYTFGSRKVK
jgi:hypothetical protein